MKFLAVHFEGADLINRFCRYSARVKIKHLQSPKGFFFLNLTKGIAVFLNRHPAT